MSDDPMVEEFFSEVNDKYYPQVMEGLTMLEGGEVAEGIEILSRPLHTIKGVTGFMPGYEEASGFTHKVEDFLKKVQNEDVEHSSENITLLSRSVNLIFQVLEQLREGDPDREEQEEVLELIHIASSLSSGEGDISLAGVEVEDIGPDHILTILDSRMHLPEHSNMIIANVIMYEPGDRILLDLSNVRTMGSAVWENIVLMGITFPLHVMGMTNDAKQTFYAWGFDDTVTVCPDRDTFLNVQ